MLLFRRRPSNQCHLEPFLFHDTEAPKTTGFAREKNKLSTRFARHKRALWKTCAWTFNTTRNIGSASTGNAPFCPCGPDRTNGENSFLRVRRATIGRAPRTRSDGHAERDVRRHVTMPGGWKMQTRFQRRSASRPYPSRGPMLGRTRRSGPLARSPGPQTAMFTEEANPQTAARRRVAMLLPAVALAFPPFLPRSFRRPPPR